MVSPSPPYPHPPLFLKGEDESHIILFSGLRLVIVKQQQGDNNGKD